MYSTIESWASSLGFVVEKKEYHEGYFWFKENDTKYHHCYNSKEVVFQILEEIKNSYIGS